MTIYTWLEQVIMKISKRCIFFNKVALNLVQLFNKNIFEMVNAFVNTQLKFQPSHFKSFIDINDNVYTPIPH